MKRQLTRTPQSLFDVSVAFFLSAKFAFAIRIVIALATFLVPSIVLTGWVVKVGDRPMPDAVTVDPKLPEPEKTEPQDVDTSDHP